MATDYSLKPCLDLCNRNDYGDEPFFLETDCTGPEIYCNIEYMSRGAICDGEAIPSDFIFDIEIVVEKSSFPAKKSLLKRCCSYFKTMFDSGFKEGNTWQIKLEDVSADVFQILLSYWQTGEIEISGQNVIELLSASDMLGLEDVKNYCLNYLKQQHISMDTCLQFYLIGRRYNALALEVNSKNILNCYFKEVSRRKQFVELDQDDLMAIIKSEHLFVDNEEIVCDAVLKWACASTDRFTLLDEVLECVRLTQLDPRYVLFRLLRNEDVKFTEKTKKILENVFNASIYNTPILYEKLYIPLRLNGSKSCVITTFGSDFSCENSCYLFKKGWDNMKYVSTRRNNSKIYGQVATCSLGYQVLVTGGGKAHGETWCYDLISNKWTAKGNLHVPRTNHQMIVGPNHAVYVVGGHKFDEDMHSHTLITPALEIEAYSLSTEKWTKISSLLMGVQNGCGFCHENSLYLFGTLQKEQFVNAKDALLDPAPVITVEYSGKDKILRKHPELACCIQHVCLKSHQCTVLNYVLPPRYQSELHYCQLVEYMDKLLILCKDVTFILPRSSVIEAQKLDTLEKALHYLHSARSEGSTAEGLVLSPGVGLDNFKAFLLGDAVYIFGGRSYIQEQKLYECRSYKIREIKLSNLVSDGAAQLEWDVAGELHGGTHEFGAALIKHVPYKVLKRIEQSVPPPL